MIDCSKINYRKRKFFKYTLQRTVTVDLRVKFTKAVVVEYFQLTVDGMLTINEGYTWDGTSGPVVDTKRNLRASLVHDALYQMIREGCITPAYEVQLLADRIFRAICKIDGVWKIVRPIYYVGLRLGGKRSARPIPQNCRVLCPSPANLVTYVAKYPEVVFPPPNQQSAGAGSSAPSADSDQG